MREAVPGWLGSLVLHLLLLSLVLAWMGNTSLTGQRRVELVPVDVVTLAENTVSPAQRARAAAPQQKSPVRKIVRHGVPAATAPARMEAPLDTLDGRLRTLAHLRQPETNLPVLDNAGASNVDAASNDAEWGSRAVYGVRDYIRNQVERRWSLNLRRLGAHDYTVLIRIELRPNGVIDKADIVDKTRLASDAAYRDIALSARNAVLLSSPIPLPAGQIDVPMNVLLRLNPKDTLR